MSKPNAINVCLLRKLTHPCLWSTPSFSEK